MVYIATIFQMVYALVAALVLVGYEKTIFGALGLIAFLTLFAYLGGNRS